jgi:hypothetical protein
MVVHPDQDSDKVASGDDVIRFGLDVLLEQEDFGSQDYEVIIEEIELCSLPSLPVNFNAPGYIHPLSGNSMDIGAKMRLADILGGAVVAFTLEQPSLVIFYMHVPEGLKADVELLRVEGTYVTKVSSDDLNKEDESFLKQEGGYQHRAVI